MDSLHSEVGIGGDTRSLMDSKADVETLQDGSDGGIVRSATFTDRGKSIGHAEFGDRLEFPLGDEKRFRTNYNYHNVIGTAFACKGRAFPSQALIIFFFVNLTVGLCSIFYSCTDADGKDVTGDYPSNGKCTKKATIVDPRMCGSLESPCKWTDSAIPNNWKFPMNHKFIYLVVAFLVVMRAKESYGYYRKAREQWSIVIYNCWECYQLMASHVHKKSLVKKAGQHLIAFAICLKGFLRRETQTLDSTKKELGKVLDDEDLEWLMSATPELGNLNPGVVGEDQNKNQELVCQHGHCAACMHVVRRCIEHGMMDNKNHQHFNLSMHVWANRRMSDLSKATCDMHRISTTPFPWVYMLHMRFLVMFYLAIIPFAIRDSVFTGQAQYPKNEGGNPKGTPKYSQIMTVFWIVLFSCLVDYAILGLEEIANELQNPFGEDVSDLPMEDFVQQIQRFLSHTAHVVYNVYDKLDEKLLALGDDLDTVMVKDETPLRIKDPVR